MSRGESLILDHLRSKPTNVYPGRDNKTFHFGVRYTLMSFNGMYNINETEIMSVLYWTH